MQEFILCIAYYSDAKLEQKPVERSKFECLILGTAIRENTFKTEFVIDAGTSF
jgi:hypothetical protein